MTTISNLTFTKQADNLATAPTRSPLVTILKEGPTMYRLYVLFYTPSSTTGLHMQPISDDAQVETEAGNVDGRGFMINGTIMSPATETYSLWLLDLEYEIDGEESKDYAIVNVSLSYEHGQGPETNRGTVTTPEDPEGPTLS